MKLKYGYFICQEITCPLKIDVERVLIDPLSLLILICINQLILILYSERVSKSS
jgi:hypothetical protein